MAQIIQSVRGMNDLLPDDSENWHQLEQVIYAVTRLFGYREIRLPLLEKTELFKRSIGEATDIVEKEMYTFTDRRGDSLTLRPEATASCVRAGIQHGLFHHNKLRLWYLGPMFRYERPQKGRYRQFYQFGIEAFGWSTPDLDAEIISFGHILWQKLKIDAKAKLEVNCLGTPDSRNGYRQQLVAYLEQNQEGLDADSQRRLHTNPLRVLDSKNPEMQEIIEKAPKISNCLSADSRRHFDRLCELLESTGINYVVNPNLVRGLDYYTDTVFEWTTDLLGAQNAFCAGGRYDGLVKSLGGGAIPGAGFALGLERLVEIVKANSLVLGQAQIDVYFCVLDDTAQQMGVALAQELRFEGISTIVHLGGGKLAQQLRQADQAKATLGIIIGETEYLSETVAVKNLRGDGEQQSVAVSNFTRTIKHILKTTRYT